jgi:trans-aconitate 2-methyltransferase
VTEWDAQAYNRVSALQQWLAEKSLVSLRLDGHDCILDVGCGDGKITAEIARRLPRGSVLGVDASHAMIAFAARTFPSTTHPNLAFQVADAAQLPLADEFDLIVSFNCLHWVRDQAAALRGIRAALGPSGSAHLRFVSRGARKALEDVIEDTRRAAPWAAYFPDYHPPYLHLTPEAYRALAEGNGLRVESLDVQQEAWDFECKCSLRPVWSRLSDGTRMRAIADGGGAHDGDSGTADGGAVTCAVGSPGAPASGRAHSDAVAG